MSDTPNPNVFFRGDDMGIGNFPIKGGKINNQPINDGGYWFEKFKEAKDRIKRLEEAGDAMEKRLHLRKNISDQFVYKGDAESVENWNKAKEDKL